MSDSRGIITAECVVSRDNLKEEKKGLSTFLSESNKVVTRGLLQSNVITEHELISVGQVYFPETCFQEAFLNKLKLIKFSLESVSICVCSCSTQLENSTLSMFVFLTL